MKAIKSKEYKKELKITWLRTIVDKRNLRYVVRSRIYPEDPNTLVLTMRGGGITLLDISKPYDPRLIQHWDEKKRRVDMEGQQREGNLLFVIGRVGEVFVFEVLKNKTIKKIGYLDLPRFGLFKFNFGPMIQALHCQLYTDQKGKKFLFVTSTWSKKIITIDISNPRKPKYITKSRTGISGIEGIQVIGDYLYTGGFRSNALKVFKIDNPKKLKRVQTLRHKNYKQMVPAVSRLFQYKDVLFTALWGDKGGIASFSLKNPDKISQLGMMANEDFEKSNRVKISGKYAFLPLEQKVGGFGVVNISNVKNMKPILTLKNIPGVKKPYTLNIKNEVIYLFGSITNSMAILKFEKK